MGGGGGVTHDARLYLNAIKPASSPQTKGELEIWLKFMASETDWKEPRIIVVFSLIKRLCFVITAWQIVHIECLYQTNR